MESRRRNLRSNPHVEHMSLPLPTRQSRRRRVVYEEVINQINDTLEQANDLIASIGCPGRLPQSTNPPQNPQITSRPCIANNRQHTSTPFQTPRDISFNNDSEPTPPQDNQYRNYSRRDPDVSMSSSQSGQGPYAGVGQFQTGPSVPRQQYQPNFGTGQHRPQSVPFVGRQQFQQVPNFGAQFQHTTNANQNRFQRTRFTSQRQVDPDPFGGQQQFYQNAGQRPPQSNPYGGQPTFNQYPYEGPGYGYPTYNQYNTNPPVENTMMAEVLLKMSQMAARQTEADLWDFDGTSCLDWPLFRRRFTTICEEGGYSNHQRVAKLDKHVKKPARDIVDIALKTASDPVQILNALDQMYGRPEIIRNEIERKIEETKQVQSPDDFKMFSCAVKNFTIAVQFLDSPYLDTRTFVQKLTGKLPHYLLVQFCEFLSARSIPENAERLQDLSQWIDSMSRAISMSFHHENPQLPTSNFTSAPPPRQEERRETMTSKCKVCDGTCRSLDVCQVFTDSDERKRKRLQESTGACWMCLGFHRGRCTKAKRCGVNNCSKFHHPLIHKEPPTNNIEQQHVNTETQHRSAMLKILPIMIYGPNGAKQIMAFMDDGSTVTMLEESVALELGLTGDTVPLTCMLASGAIRYESKSITVEAEVSSINCDSKPHKILNVRTVHDLGVKPQYFDWDTLKEKYPYLEIINHVKHDLKPQLLIGQSNAHLLKSKITVQPSPVQPCITKTVLGWVAHGPIDDQNKFVTISESQHSCQEVTNEELHDLVLKNFHLEDYLTTIRLNKKSAEEERAEKIANETTVYENNTYTIGLPWMEDNPVFPDTYHYAKNRLFTLEKKLKSNAEMAVAYQAEIQKWLEKGYAVPVSDDEFKSAERVWFLAHFGVTNPNKPGKVRVVFDYAAKVKGKALNDYLLSGPDLLNSIYGILLRFRTHDVAWTSDVAEMFNRIFVRYEDTFCQLFLWRDLDSSKPIKMYRVRVVNFGATCSPYLSQFIKNFNADSFADVYPKATADTKNEVFVDDYVGGAATDEEGIKLVKEVNEIQAYGNFTLRNYVSNSKAVLESLPEELKATNNQAVLLKDKDESHRVLGILWDANTDQLSFSTNFHKVKPEVLNGARAPTKREILSATMSLYNPVGELTPITIKPRILMQDVWAADVFWDDQIKGTLFDRWLACLKQIEKIKNVKLHRRYCPNLHNAVNIQLHTFVDASEEAYAATILLRAIVNNTVYVSFVTSKAKVAPRVKGRLKLTIPRLELLAALLGVRLHKVVTSELPLKFSSHHFWTDSKTVLHWINADRSINSFVDSRLVEILSNTQSKQWKWIKTSENPADLATREKTNIEMGTTGLWFTGPPFLQTDESQWPSQTADKNIITNREEKLYFEQEIDSPIPAVANYLPKIAFNHSWFKILKVTARLQHIIDNFQQNSWRYKEITVENLEWAEKQWWKKVQNEKFPIDLKNLRKNNKNTTGRLSQIACELDVDGVIRTVNRFKYCQNDKIVTSGQVVLDGDHEYTKKLLHHIHIQYRHVQFETVVNEVLKQYYIPKLRAKLSRIFSECKRCRRYKAEPSTQMMGPIPESRLQVYKKPFTQCGIDYFGPYYVKQGRTVVKRYGCMFMCLTSRAIHTELVPDLTTSSVINAIRRLMCLFGMIEILYSDNGPNFRGASRELIQAFEAMDLKSLAEFMLTQRIQWKFNPPYTPHLGGSYERVIGTFKRALSTVLNDRVVTEDTLSTMFRECQKVVNDRPLTFVSTRFGDVPAITPNDLLQQQNATINPLGDFNEEPTKYERNWRVGQILADQFWNRFMKEYTNTIKNITKWKHKNCDMKVGSVVIIKDQHLPRTVWPLGVIEEVKYGRDGATRIAKIRLANGNVIERHAIDIYQLGINSGEEVEEPNVVSQSHPEDEPSCDTGGQNVEMNRN